MTINHESLDLTVQESPPDMFKLEQSTLTSLYKDPPGPDPLCTGMPQPQPHPIGADIWWIPFESG